MKKQIALIIVISICLTLVLIVGMSYIKGEAISDQNSDIIDNIIIGLIAMASGILMSAKK